MSSKSLAETFTEKKSASEPMDTLLEVNENVPEVLDRPFEESVFEEIQPKIFSLKNITEPLTIPSLNNAIYELGVIDLCWPEITEPVFETRTSFPKSYYTNSTKERLLLAYAENFRRQFQFHYRTRKPLFFQAPNECGLQKMVCTSIRPTKLCYAHTNTWQGVASLVADYFDYEPLKKCMLHESVYSPEVQQEQYDSDHDDMTSNEENTSSEESESAISELVTSQIEDNDKLKTHQGNNEKKLKKSVSLLKDYEKTKARNVSNAISGPVNESENEFDIFGKSIAAQLKNMPLNMAVEAQRYIQNYLSEMRLKALRHTMNNS